MKKQCPCCLDSLISQVRHNRVYCFCPNCRQEMPNPDAKDGYDFNESKAVVDGKFLGLAIDEDNQSDMTELRVKSWVSQLKKEFSL